MNFLKPPKQPNSRLGRGNDFEKMEMGEAAGKAAEVSLGTAVDVPRVPLQCGLGLYSTQQKSALLWRALAGPLALAVPECTHDAHTHTVLPEDLCKARTALLSFILLQPSTCPSR